MNAFLAGLLSILIFGTLIAIVIWANWDSADQMTGRGCNKPVPKPDRFSEEFRREVSSFIENYNSGTYLETENLKTACLALIDKSDKFNLAPVKEQRKQMEYTLIKKYESSTFSGGTITGHGQYYSASSTNLRERKHYIFVRQNKLTNKIDEKEVDIDKYYKAKEGSTITFENDPKDFYIASIKIDTYETDRALKDKLITIWKELALN